MATMLFVQRAGLIFIVHLITEDVTVPSGRTLLLRDPELSGDVEITVEAGGEVLIL